MFPPMPEFDPEKWEAFSLDLSEIVSDGLSDKYLEYIEKYFLEGSGEDEPIGFPIAEAQ